MGCRVHVIKKQREYGNHENFNYQIEEFENLLSALGCEICKQEDDIDFFEVDRDEYKRAIDVLKVFNKCTNENDFNVAVLKKFGKDVLGKISIYDDINDCIKQLEGSKVDKIIETMEIFYRERDKKSGWIQFEMW